jgi:hypothetical protein
MQWVGPPCILSKITLQNFPGGPLAKIYSIFEPHTDLIKRGKVRTPVEFGHKVFLAESALVGCGDPRAGIADHDAKRPCSAAPKHPYPSTRP